MKTEIKKESLILVGADALKPVWEDVFVDIEKEPFEPEMLVTNLGRLRLLKGLDEGISVTLYASKTYLLSAAQTPTQRSDRS